MEAKRAFLLSCLLCALLWFIAKRPLYECLTVSIVGFLGLGGLWPTYYALKTLPRDLRLLAILVKLQTTVVRLNSQGDTVTSMYSKLVKAHPNKPAILFEDQSWSFKDIDTYSNKVANFFKSQGIQCGDNVSIYMQNRPEYICVLLGLVKIGAKCPLINYNLTGQSLLHCINTVGTKAIVYEECLESSISSVYSSLDKEIQGMVFCFRSRDKETSEGCVGRDFESEMEHVSVTPPPPVTSVKPDDVFCYIYTSGTTGLPKAVPMKHVKAVNVPIGFQYLGKLTDDDIVYVSLPLYHSTGLVIGMGQMFITGKTVALRRKFSARNFWKDCIKFKCTVIMYIGEVLRYVLAVPPDTSDKGHSVRIAIGNGLRPDIWNQFKTRFEIPKIFEFYAATEGNVGLFNIFGKDGSVGFKFKLLGFIMKQYLVQADPTTGEVLRDSNGYCTVVPQGQPGLLIGIIKPNDLFTRFDGYTNKEATNKKILHDVFKKGDTYFNTGDILYQDVEGYYYFSDRAGDTFRWKGENVSTTEVENIISSLLPVSTRDVVVVFGVELPRADGRAGMAVIPKGVAKDINVSEFYSQLKPLLPSYALPLFLRFVDSVDLTGTFKLQKTRYRKEGYDPSVTRGDEVYVFDKSQSMYVPFNEEQYQMIQDGTLRF